MTGWTHIVVGGGAAGCAIAGRLSADPATLVLLLEAGQDIAPGAEPAAIRDPYPVYSDPRYMWKLTAEVGADPGTGAPPLSRAYAQGKLIGGSSSVNGMSAQRGLAEDYDGWSRAGAAGWAWDDVLPFFRRMETDADFDGALHGKDGPLPIRRYRREDWPPFVAAVAGAMEALGYPYQPDLVAGSGDCVTRMALNNTEDGRVSAALAYLPADVRGRPNLAVRGDAHVERLVFEGRRAVGVQLDGPGGEVLRGQEIVLCGGGIQSPLLLLRSGIGPEGELRTLGIPVVADRPGVGRGVRNHSAVHLATHLPARSIQPEALRSWAFALLRFSSGHPGCGPGDMQIFPTNRGASHPLGQRIGTMSICLYQPKAEGSIRLRRSVAGLVPDIRFNTLGHPDDKARLTEALRLAGRLLADPAVSAVRNDVFVPSGGQANALNRPGRLNRLKSRAIAALFDGPAWFRRLLLRGSLVDARRLATDRALCEAIVTATAASVHHVSCGCRMGDPRDPQAVVDPSARVIGVDGLRIADLSICPTIVRAATHLTAIMIGEKVAQIILDEAPARTTDGEPTTTNTPGTPAAQGRDQHDRP